jgi:hypothetical protein
MKVVADGLLPPLYVGGTAVKSIFELVGKDEDSISLAIAWGLRSCPHFLQASLRAMLGETPSLEGVSITIHRYEAAGGITDIEVESPGTFHAIVEAKRGWILPSLAQLQRYAGRESFAGSMAPIKRLVTLSECSELHASRHYAGKQVAGHALRHISWKTMAQMCTAAASHSGHAEKRVLQDLREYLENAMTTQQKDSNLVYVVSLGPGTPAGWQTSWIDVVRKYRKYFHPLSGTWPKSPPNYLGFRYGGLLQSIHHVEKYAVVNDIGVACPGIPNDPCEPHYLYHLGKPIVPGRSIKNGAVWPSGRVWCALDTLLTCDTVSQARDMTAKRRGGTISAR